MFGFRAIIEKTLGGVEGPDEIFSSASKAAALSFRKKETEIQAQVPVEEGAFRPTEIFCDTLLFKNS